MNKSFHTQWISAGIEGFYEWQQTKAAQDVEQLLQQKLHNEHSFQQAFGHFLKMRLFLSTPEHILGSPQTKHGEIAEHLDVHVRNAHAVFQGMSPIATIDTVKRNAPVDFFIHNEPFQSKFTNNVSNTLTHFTQHRHQYPDLPMRYMMPREQFDIMDTLLKGNQVPNISDKQAIQLLQKAQFLEEQSGQAFHKIVTPSVATYDEVQLGTIHETVRTHEQQLIDAQQQRREQLKEELQQKAALAHQKPVFSWQHGLTLSASSAIISASLHSGIAIFKKIRSGQPLHTFTKEDWQQLGIQSTKVGAKSGVTAFSIYTLTQITTLTAPLAGGLTSATFGLASLLAEKQQGKRTWEDVFTDGQILCLESAIAALAAYFGQLIIPIPVVGAILGTISAQLVCHLLKTKFHVDAVHIDTLLNTYNAEIEKSIDDAYTKLLQQIQKRYHDWQQLIADAFSPQLNAQLFAEQSVIVARTFGVDEQNILTTVEHTDAFFLD